MNRAKAKTKPQPKVKKPAMSLPTWNLSHLVPAPAEKNIQKMLQGAATKAKSFQKAYKGKLAKLSARDFAAAVASYESLSETLSRAYNYASLDRQTRLDDAKVAQLYQSVMEKVNEISTEVLFFTLELNKIPDAALKAKLRDKSAARYKPFIEQVRAFRSYQLSDEIERTLHERSVVGASAWTRMFDETMARLRFPVGGKMVTETEVFHMMLSRDGKVRKTAAKALEKVFGDNVQTLGFIYNTIIKEKDIDDRQRGFTSPMASRNLGNQVEDKVVEALVRAVKEYYPKLSHRYYKLKAKWMGVKTMNYWDRNAPLPFAADKKMNWREARDSVLGAYGRFHPDMAKIGARFFDEGWIDAAPRPGKDSGAFSAPTVPSVHPYIMMNYKGNIQDVMTLAHELGHGVHQVLSAKQGYLMSDTPLTLAETASVFGEMLTFQELLKSETKPENRKAMLAKKVEDMLNTVVRQIAFHEFEWRVHNERKAGELTPDRLSKIWMDVMSESLGPAFTFDDGYKYFWSYIGHFYHTPFYVYAYAFGDCLVNALYAVYQKSERGFAEKYMALLAAGGTKKYDELLKPFGLNAADPAFWKRGLDVISGFIDQLEADEKKRR